MTTLELRERLALVQADYLPEGQREQFYGLLGNGETAQFALMVASARAPGVRGGDRGFNENARHRMDTMPEYQREAIVRIAQRAGINTQGKYYVGGLGRYTDPAAWCSTTDDVMASAKAKDMIVTGSVNYDPGESRQLEQRRAKPKPKLAEDITREMTDQYINNDPALRAKCIKDPKKVLEVQEMVIAKHGRQD